MSYWVHLVDSGDNELQVESHTEGGTYAVGGTSDASLNVTYNYARIYREHEFSLRDLDGRKAGETTDTLASLVEVLGDDPDDDYWKPTPGNAGHALNILLGWSRQHPEATWRVS